MRKLRITAFLLTLAPALSLSGPAPGQALPVTGVQGARFRVGDVEMAREFYTRVFGLPEKGGAGPGRVSFQIGGRQFVEFSTGPAGDSRGPLEALVFGTSGQAEAPLNDQDAHRLEFVPDVVGTTATVTASASGAPGVSDHLLHVGMGTGDLKAAGDFYADRLGCKEIWRGPTPAEARIVILRVPGPREDWVEFLLPGPQGSPDHICLEVPDIQRAYRTLLERGATTRGKPRIASNGHWVINLVDPNGIRVELMEPRPAAK
jgi:catechol 2,3-dioxygenase-like lactoylglutathione lyase family enzyme